MDRIMAQLDVSLEELKSNLEYYKRDDIEIDGFRRRFWFRHKKHNVIKFHVDLYGQELYDFLDNYEIGDIVDLL